MGTETRVCSVCRMKNLSLILEAALFFLLLFKEALPAVLLDVRAKQEDGMLPRLSEEDSSTLPP